MVLRHARRLAIFFLRQRHRNGKSWSRPCGLGVSDVPGCFLSTCCCCCLLGGRFLVDGRGVELQDELVPHVVMLAGGEVGVVDELPPLGQCVLGVLEVPDIQRQKNLHPDLSMTVRVAQKPLYVLWKSPRHDIGKNAPLHTLNRYWRGYISTNSVSITCKKNVLTNILLFFKYVYCSRLLLLLCFTAIQLSCTEDWSWVSW